MKFEHSPFFGEFMGQGYTLQKIVRRLYDLFFEITGPSAKL